MAQMSITLHVRPRWWFGPVLKLMLGVHLLTGWAPSTATIRRLTNYGISYKTQP